MCLSPPSTDRVRECIGDHLGQRHRRVADQAVQVSGLDEQLAGGIVRSSLLARLIVTAVLAPGVGPMLARLEPKPIIRAVLRGASATRLPSGRIAG